MSEAYGPSPAVSAEIDAEFEAASELCRVAAHEGAKIAHDPALGRKRSVCLEAVIEFLCDPAHGLPAHPEGHPWLLAAADRIEREFGNAR
jgi:hypothetical protein